MADLEEAQVLEKHTTNTQNEAPAHHLLGMTLKNGWKVVEKYLRTDGLSAGKYSVGYYVERNGTCGFLKAIDYSRAAKAEDIPQALLELTQAFQFERSMLERCAARKMDRVVSPIEDGEATVGTGILSRVNYLIFDEAEDIRNTLARINRSELVVRLRILHHVATGMYQLHSAGIAHQDLKAANVLSFGDICKVADLGSGSLRGTPAPRDSEHCKGTKAYAPPELLYDQIDGDFNVRRFGCDAYLMGSLVAYLFTAVGVTSNIVGHLATEHKPHALGGGWTGSYQEVLPYVQNAFGLALVDFASEVSSPKLEEELTLIVRQLCEPNPVFRGHPDARRQKVGNPYSLERYVTWFDLLARRASLGIFDGKKH